MTNELTLMYKKLMCEHPLYLVCVVVEGGLHWHVSEMNDFYARLPCKDEDNLFEQLRNQLFLVLVSLGTVRV